MPSRLAPSSLPARYRAQIAAQIGGGVSTIGARPSGPASAPAAATLAAEGRMMLRQSGDTLNKTEAAFLDHLRANHPDAAFIEPHALTLRLANGCRYTPDFILADASGLTAYETKGHMRDDAAVKLKVAASRFPFITFILVWRDRRAADGWGTQTISA